ncbi:MAG: NAD(+)/NADH kinase [Planctomycetes bacterium]|nr:NAD(+)/NADH kinase [Planctomycetota bacterium]
MAHQPPMAPALHLAPSPVAATRTALVVMNPVAGLGRSSEVRELLRENLTAAGFAPAIYETNGRDNPSRVVRNAVDAGCALVVAVGGDGTVSQAASGIVGSTVPLLIIPAGTANLFAREMGVPLEVEAACRILWEDHRLVDVDVMRVGGRVCLCKVSLGVYSLVADKAGRPAKRRFGRLAYAWWLLREALQKRSWTFDITVDGRHERLRASMVWAVNAGEVGFGSLRWGEGIDPTDGVVDLIVIRTATPTGYLSLLWRALLRRTDDSPEVVRRSIRKQASISTRTKLPVRGDGEVIGRTRVEIDVVPRAVRVLVPGQPND